jgi:hypothetical protein
MDDAANRLPKRPVDAFMEDYMTILQDSMQEEGQLPETVDDFIKFAGEEYKKGSLETDRHELLD